MTMLKQAVAWLETWPGMERLEHFWVEETGTVPNTGGIYPRGMTEVERREDILGNVEVDCQFRFQLFYVLAKTPGASQEAEHNAEWLMELQEWVQEQSAKGLAPRFGDTGRETAKAEGGRLYRQNEDGTATYWARLIINFKKRYEV